MPESLDMLVARLDALSDDFAVAQAQHADALGTVAEGHRAGAVNLVDYTTLRHRDRRALQSDLMDVGATSLASTEADVQAKVHAARNVLAALRGDAGPWNLEEITAALEEGDRILAAHSDAVFGPMRPGRPTRIMVTLPTEAADDAVLVASFVEAGMDVARINCAHDDADVWARMAAIVRAAASAAGRQVLVSMDLPGPKLRTGPIIDGPAVARARVTRDASGQVLAPARIWLTSADEPTPAPPSPAHRPTLVLQVDDSWLAAREPGDRISTTDARGPHRTFTVVTVGAGGVLAANGRHNTYVADGAEKGINLPDTLLHVPALTADDHTHLAFIAQHADMVAVPFIRAADDVAHVIDRMHAAGAGELGLVLKIETRQGFENLLAILLAGMRHPRLAVMVASRRTGRPVLGHRRGSNADQHCHLVAVVRPQLRRSLSQPSRDRLRRRIGARGLMHPGQGGGLRLHHAHDALGLLLRDRVRSKRPTQLFDRATRVNRHACEAGRRDRHRHRVVTVRKVPALSVGRGPGPGQRRRLQILALDGVRARRWEPTNGSVLR